MLKNKKIIASFFVIIMIASLSINAFALSSYQESQIIYRCDLIKETLKGVQHSDSYSRTYLGSVYEKMLGNYIIPFNNRLLKLNIKNEDLIKIQEDFVEERANFNKDFISYSKTLEEQINIDCKTNPKEFYQKLEKTRKERIKVNEDVEKIEKIIQTEKETVKQLKGKL